MILLDRRAILLGGAATIFAAPASAARTVSDSAARTVNVPDVIARVMAAGPPASAAVYCLSPDKLIGWQRAPSPEDKRFLLPSTHDLPELGRLTGRGDTANIEVVLKAMPDLIVDFGSVLPTYVSLANATQNRTGVPYVLIDGRFEATAASLRLLGGMLGVGPRAEELASYAGRLLARVDADVARIPSGERPKVYLARGPAGLETALKGSINAEIIERAGGLNVAEAKDARRGIANVSPEQILAWQPDVIITWDRSFFRLVTESPGDVWRAVPAVANQRVHLAPTAPFGWIDGPPSVNRLIGLTWLANVFHGARATFVPRHDTRVFYKLFYHVDLTEPDLDTLLAWTDGRPPKAPVRR